MNQENYKKIAEIIKAYSYETKAQGKAIHPLMVGELAVYFAKASQYTNRSGITRTRFNKIQFLKDCGIKK